MPKTPNKKLKNFGKRLRKIRKKAGLTQVELAKKIGISQRMLAYYEGQTEHPPTKILPELTKALKVSADELLGIKPLKN